MNKKEEECIDKLIDTKLEYKLKTINNLQKKDIIILLRNYTKYTKKLEKLKEEIFNIQNDKVSVYNSKNNESENVQTSKIYKDPLIIVEDRIELLNKKINSYTYLLDKLNLALNIIDSSDYSAIIKYRYFEKMPVSNILFKMNISESTYKRHHNKLLSEIKSILIL